MTTPKSISEALGTVVPIASSEWTDEQWAEHDAKVAEARARSEQENPNAKILAMSAAGWPERAVRAAIAADITRPAVKLLGGADLGKANVIVLSGSPGCGKTVASAKWGLARRHPPRFLRASTFAASSRYSAEDRKLWFEASSLVLDDLGSEYLDAKGSFLVDLDELIDTFYGDLRPLVITTNCRKPTFEQRYGERVMDRLRECATWFSIGEASLRRKP